MIQQLEDLEILVKNIWPHSDQWRYNNGNIEWSIKISKGEREWFPLHQAPMRIEKFVRSYKKLSDLD